MNLISLVHVRVIFLQVILPGIPKVEETKVQRETLNPEWEEIFEYNVPREELQDR